MLYALIVIYNKKVSESITYNSLLNYSKFLKLIVFDNSKEEFINYNNRYCADNNITYYTLNNNVGLSKAYNYVTNKLEKNDDYIMIFDDDTPINDEYMNDVLNNIKSKEYDVILPIIYSKNRIISPANVQFNCRIKILNSLSDLKPDKISAINSGMVIKMSVFSKIAYNENMFLDYVDHDFMKKVRENKFKIHVLSSSLNQNYSRFQMNNIESELFRFKIHYKDFKIYCKNCHNMLFFYISTLKYRLHEVKKYKTLKFLFIK